ncbi:MAG: DsbA family protein [Acidobacteriota bacterium]
MKKWIPVFIIILAGTAGILAGSDLQKLSFTAKEFTDAFNESADTHRLVMVTSPTCPHCIKAVAELQEILEKHPDGKLKVMLLWGPLMQTDTSSITRRAMQYIKDKRVDHYWDLWRWGYRTYTENLKIPEFEAWDLFVFYEAGKKWEEGPPDPTFWMENRTVEYGPPYSREAMEDELLKWIK